MIVFLYSVFFTQERGCQPYLVVDVVVVHLTHMWLDDGRSISSSPLSAGGQHPLGLDSRSEWRATFLPIVLPMAEMASMAPTASGKYHWVPEHAHPKYRNWLSY